MVEIQKVVSDRELVQAVFPGCFSFVRDFTVSIMDSEGKLIETGSNFGEAYRKAAIVARHKLECTPRAPVSHDHAGFMFGALVIFIALALWMAAVVGLAIWATIRLCVWASSLPGNAGGIAFLVVLALGICAAHVSELRAKGKEDTDVCL